MLTTLERFWVKVRKTETCWLWTGARGSGTHRYGHFWMPAYGRVMNAHRAIWILLYGPIADDVEVCHDCPGGDNPQCVNPAHLFLGTRVQNAQDAKRKGRLPWTRRTHCPNGHALVGENIKTFRRVAYPGLTFTTCRTCARAARMRRYYEQRGRRAS